MTRRLVKQGDRTTSGGKVISATSGLSDEAIRLVLDGDKALCPKCGDSFPIVGTAIYFTSGGRRHVASGDKVLCHCPNNLVIGSSMYWVERTVSRTRALHTSLLSTQEPVQDTQTANDQVAPVVAVKKLPEPLTLPVRIYTTKRVMDDYEAKDMHYGDLSEETLKGHFGLTDVSEKVNPYTQVLSTPVAGRLSGSFLQQMSRKPVMVSRDESARLMFDEFQELAKVFSFWGEYKGIISEMISHMQDNSGRPYRNTLLDKALKEQILNDRTEQSSLLSIKRALSTAVNYEYGFIPLDKKDDLFDRNGNFKAISSSILPKFDRLIDRINGLVISVHDSWSTHITLESLDVLGDSFRAKIHYRIQDHFGLDNDDILNLIYHEARIFRIWFVLQRYVKYGYKPFITEMEATVEITGSRHE